MTKPMIRIHNSATDEVIDREMTTAEFEQYELGKATEAQAKAEAKARDEAKAALLAKLGITADEAKLLLG